MKILVTGGAGQLAQELVRIDPKIDSPDRSQMDFSRYESIEAYCKDKKYDIVIHAGAATNKLTPGMEESWVRANIIGTSNIVLWCMKHKARLVYLSTDYVYPGETGDYSEESPLLPINNYAKSKLGGEMAVQLYENSLVIRTSFYAKMDFEAAAKDQFTSRIPLHAAAKEVLKFALKKDLKGVINLGRTQKRSIYEIVKNEFNPSVRAVLRRDLKVPYPLPADSSLNLTRMLRLEDLSEAPSIKRTTCRACGSKKLKVYLDLGQTPLANSYIKASELNGHEFKEKLSVQLCLDCGLSQLTHVVHPDRMFKNYLYVSSTPQTFRDHCVSLAKTAQELLGLKQNDLVVDIASNDGCLLSKFQDIGMRVVGVDPAENLAAEATARGIRTLCAYWTPGLAKDLAARFGNPRVITAQNVFAHADDMENFVRAVESILASRGVFMIEFPYLMDLIKHNEFDTIYHEHLSYVGVTPVVSLLARFGMEIFDVGYFPEIHGGTVRIYAARRGDYAVRPAVKKYLAAEAKFGIKKLAPYQKFAKKVLQNKKDLLKLIEAKRKEGSVIWAYGASAKGNTLMNFYGLTQEEIPVAVDDNPKKWQYLTPGAHMKIVGASELGRREVDYLLLLAWNFSKEIMKRARAAGYKGKFITPVPVPKVLS